MSDYSAIADRLVFGLDIGTRSIVGSVGYLEKKKFKVLAHCSMEHETRAMLDGQIHDIHKVADTIIKVKNELEKQLELPLNEVCIAAAGRVLKTITVTAEIEYEENTVITPDQIHTLDLAGIEKAYEGIREQEKDSENDFFCVGYTVVKYFLNDYQISNLEGHKGKKISCELLATFLPDEVVDSLYAAIDLAELQVANLTLEPIAAINVAIPEKFRMLNIALVDVGAGTSDICITKDGSIVAYGMIPAAGDEISDSLVQKYLVEFSQAEKMKREAGYKEFVEYKDIIGLPNKITAEEVVATFAETVNSITGEVAEKIKELNGGKSVSAVFVVGGGGKAKGFTDTLANHLEIIPERVALRGEEVLGEVEFIQEDVVKDPLLVTPIGICLNYFEQKNNFIFVSVNGERIKLYNSNTLTVADAAIQIGFPNDCIFPKTGKELNFYVNGKKRMKRGSGGDAAKITINGEDANIYSPIGKNNKIIIEESTAGAPARMRIEQLPEFTDNLKFMINGKEMEFPRFVNVNDELMPGSYYIQEEDCIEFVNYYTVEQILTFLDVNPSLNDVYINDIIASNGDLVYEGFRVKIELTKEKYEPESYTDMAVAAASEAEESEQPLEKTSEVTEIPKEDLSDEQPKAVDNNLMNNNSEAVEADSVTDEASKEKELEIGKVTEPAKQVRSIHDIGVICNGTPLVLKGKSLYTFVDVFDYINFDLSYKKGYSLLTTINGMTCTYTQELNDGDMIVVEWQEDN